MSNAVIPRMQGDDYQAYYFWHEACRLFMPSTKVERVTYEGDLKSFDDVIVQYSEKIQVSKDSYTTKDYLQIKFHVACDGDITCAGLMDPKFINAEKISILQRLHQAQKTFAPDGNGCRFYLVAPWAVKSDDLLGTLLMNYENEINLEKLFDGKTKSHMAKMRESMKTHLGITSDDELRNILKPLRIYDKSLSLKRFENDLSMRLESIGLKPIENGSDVNPYIHLIQSQLAKGNNEFTKKDIYELCKREKLWTGNPVYQVGSDSSIGIRSFHRRAEHMEEETNSMICFLEYFDDRKIKDASYWSEKIYPALDNFMLNSVKTGQSYQLHLDAHYSIGFAAGYLLDSKVGASVAPFQRTPWGKCLWRPDYKHHGEGYEPWNIEKIDINKDANDVALVLNVTRGIYEEVLEYVKDKLPVGRIINCTIGKIPTASIVKDGTHAWLLSTELAAIIKTRTLRERKAHLHIFASGPASLLFFLGQLAQDFGKCTIYEYGFKGNMEYTPGLTLPPSQKVS